MKLYLVQHADAVPKDEDPRRPLSGKGLEDAVKVAAFLHGADVLVDELVHSGKLRAEQTANVLSKTVWLGRTPPPMAGLEPKAPTDHLYNAAMIAGGDLMAVGHRPFMDRLAARCLTGAEDGARIAFEPGSVLCLERVDGDDGTSWALAWFVRPSMLPEA